MFRWSWVLLALAYFAILEVMLVAAVLAYPALLENLPHLRGLAGQIPVVGDMFQQVEEHGFQAHVLVHHFFKGCNTLGTAAAVLFAAPAVAGEAHRGTLEMWLALPFSRRRLLLERYLLGALVVVLPVFLSTLTIPLLGARVDELEPYGPYLRCAVHQSLFLLAIYGVTFLLSCLGSNPTKIALALLFLTTFEFAIYMISNVTHWSLFRLCDMWVMLRIAEDGRLDAGIVAALLGAIAACLAASLAAFQRRTP